MKKKKVKGENEKEKADDNVFNARSPQWCSTKGIQGKARSFPCWFRVDFSSNIAHVFSDSFDPRRDRARKRKLHALEWKKLDRTKELFADGSCNLILYIGYILYIVKSLCDINGYVFTIKCGDGTPRVLRWTIAGTMPRRPSLVDARFRSSATLYDRTFDSLDDCSSQMTIFAGLILAWNWLFCFISFVSLMKISFNFSFYLSSFKATWNYNSSYSVRNLNFKIYPLVSTRTTRWWFPILRNDRRKLERLYV